MTWESELFEGYSYPFSKHAFQCRFTRARLLANEREIEVKDASVQSVLALHEHVEHVEEWDRLQLTLEISARPGCTSRPWLQVACEDTRIEILQDLASVDLSAVTVDLDIGELRGTVMVRALGVDASAVDEGIVDADSEALLVQVDLPSEPFGGGLRTVWDCEYFASRGFGNALTVLDFPADGEPCLYLNSGVRDFQQLLTSKAPHGVTASSRRLILDWIECDTWFALARRGASDVFRMDTDADEAVLENEELLEEWQGAALRRVAKMLGHGVDPDSLSDTARMLFSADHHEAVRAAITSSVGRGSGLRLRLETLAGDLGKGRGEDS